MKTAKDRTQSAMGGSKSSKKSKRSGRSGKRVREMHIRGTSNQRYIIRHDHHASKDGAAPGQEEHGASNLQELLDHVGEHAANMGPEEPESEPEQTLPQAA